MKLFLGGGKSEKKEETAPLCEAWSNLVKWKLYLPMSGGWNKVILMSLLIQLILWFCEPSL